MNHRGIGLLLAALFTLFSLSAALAAPDRFDNQVRDAVPDPENTYNFSFNNFVVNTEGPVTSERSTHQLLRFGYQFSDKLNASFHFGSHDLSGGLGLTSPIFSNLDSAQSYGVQLDMNLLNEPAVPAGPEDGSVWTPGSAFSIGFIGNSYSLDRSGVGETETELGAYLAYSTDLTEELRGHTYFSTSRLTGDNASGSANRVGAGLDYLLMGGDRPLVLMANGIIDIYNFRQPQFNTSRISRFDFGLRYKLAREWDAQLGWSTFNDSEEDSSGSGIFAGINWRSIKDPCHCGNCSKCGFADEEIQPTMDVDAAPSQASIDAAVVAAAANLSWDPADTPMMELDYPENYDRTEVEQGLRGADAEALRVTASAASEPDSDPGQAIDTEEVIAGDDGIAIPLFPEEPEYSPALPSADGDSAAPGLSLQSDTETAESAEAAADQQPGDVEVQLPAADEEITELQSFMPRATPLDARLSRAPAITIDNKVSTGIADACSRYLFIRLAGLPRQLMARAGN